MGGAASLDWVYTVAGWALAAAGVALLLWALFWDRSRGRRRCPKCWYDMAGVPGLMCPECGREARLERTLHRTRRHWRPVAVAALLLLCGGMVPLIPTVRRGGWLAATPSWVLVRLLPAESLTRDRSTQPPSQFVGRIEDELAQRVYAGRLRGSAWGYVIRQVPLLTTRARWPAEAPLLVAVHDLPPWASGVNLVALARLPECREVSSWMDSSGVFVNGEWDHFLGRRLRQQCGTPVSTARKIVFDARVEEWNGPPAGRAHTGRLLWSGTITVPVGIVASVDEAIVPDGSAQLTEVVRNHLHLQFIRVYTGQCEFVAALVREGSAELADVAVGLGVEISRDGRPVASTTMPLTFEGSFQGIAAWDTWMFGGIDQASLSDWAELARWTVKVRGNGAAALGDYARSRYWAGQFEVPLRDIANWMR